MEKKEVVGLHTLPSRDPPRQNRTGLCNSVTVLIPWQLFVLFKHSSSPKRGGTVTYIGHTERPKDRQKEKTKITMTIRKYRNNRENRKYYIMGPKWASPLTTSTIKPQRSTVSSSHKDIGRAVRRRRYTKAGSNRSRTRRPSIEEYLGDSSSIGTSPLSMESWASLAKLCLLDGDVEASIFIPM
ncbi:hypothetical protein Taro_004036 [Colocasia esculenta]|uniref:Uncharacterized protein n=1 Tax=Colocasia esculenta TaxID=4460 RepID=A0A843TH30_COLES|nr:hypothetical protein [Colocasia esculenta]